MVFIVIIVWVFLFVFEVIFVGIFVFFLEILVVCRGFVIVVSILRVFVNVCKDIIYWNLIKIRKEGNKYFCLNIGEVYFKSFIIKKKLIFRGVIGCVLKVLVIKY